MLGADGRVVEAGRDGVRRENLPVVVGEKERPRPVQDADAPRTEAGRVLAGGGGTPAGLDADELDGRSARKAWKRPIAFEPPPTQATRRSGSFPPRTFFAWARVSRPMTAWKSRTIRG